MYNKGEIDIGKIITFLGIGGIVISLLAFFSYAIINNIIGKLGQVLVGILVGASLLGISYKVIDKKRGWSLFLMGGSFLLEYISISVGVLNYNVIPKYLGLVLLTGLVIYSLYMGIYYSSRTISYYSLIGGYLTPLLAGFIQSSIFLVLFSSILALALLYLSINKDWPDIKLVSLLAFSQYVYAIPFATEMQNIIVILLASIVIFLSYNISSIYTSVSQKKELPITDIFTLNLNSLISFSWILPIVFNILKSSKEIAGTVALLFSLFFIGELLYIRGKEMKMSLKYSLFLNFLVFFNIGIILFLADLVRSDIFYLIFILEYILFNLLQKETNLNSWFLKIFSWAFLFLSIVWYLGVIRFSHGLTHATIYIIIFLLSMVGFYTLYRYNIAKKLNGVLALIFGFIVMFSVAKYLVFFIGKQQFFQMILSILWIGYSLAVLLMAKKNYVLKVFGLIFLSITLIKIIFSDLLMLEGIFRIIGFFILGVVLLVGGYFLSKE